MKTIKKVLFFLLNGVLLVSCSNDTIFQESKDIAPDGWIIDSTYNFSVNIEDNKQHYDIDILLRHSGTYAFQNIWLFVETIDPYEQISRDTVEYYLADNRGRWLGSGLGSLFQLNLPFKTNYLYPMPGLYQYKIQQGMRYNPLEGITNIGLIIKKNKLQQ